MKKTERRLIDEEIAEARNEIRTDKLDISYGELANMYEEGEIKIRPEFQRLFRWNDTQKTRFIESILLGFPTPAIFVAEDAEGVWELVDGLQRVSTILEFMGLLKDEKKNAVPASRLVAVRRPQLPSIGGALYKDLSLKARLSLKRAGCRVEVVKTGSKPKMKYEVFERLNTGGSGLTEQEVRNCIFRATDPKFVDWIESLASYPHFANSLCISDFQKSTMFDRGLILRYLTIKNAYEEFEHDVEPFITDYIREVIDKSRNFDMSEEETLFKRTTRLIDNALGEDAWRHYKGGKHKGPLSVYVFETVSIGFAVNIDSLENLEKKEIRRMIIKFKSSPSFLENTGAGANIKSKLLKRIKSARTFFQEND